MTPRRQGMKTRRTKSGRHSGKEIEIKKGRPTIPMIDRIATQAWFNALKNASNSENAYQVAKQYDESLESKRFEKYARGAVRPTAGTLKAVDDKLNRDFGIKVQMVFDDGPEGVPLWDAIAGDFEVLWDIIYKASPRLATLKTMRASHGHKEQEFISSLFSESIEISDTSVSSGILSNANDPKINNIYIEIRKLMDHYQKLLPDLDWNISQLVISKIMAEDHGSNEAQMLLKEEHNRRDRFAKEMIRHEAMMLGSQWHLASTHAEWRHYYNYQLHKDGKINFSFEQLAATIALWRIGVLVSDGVSKLDYLLTVLLDGVISEMLRPYGVEKKVIELLQAMQDTYHRSLYP